jgi:hypothetical protein
VIAREGSEPRRHQMSGSGRVGAGQPQASVEASWR